MKKFQKTQQQIIKNEGATLGGAVSGKVVVNSDAKEATKEEVAAGVASKLGVKEVSKKLEIIR